MKKMRELNLRELQLTELSILEDFAHVCDKYKLKYSLAYGTLLGAVRHKGFIPWDDDVDVWMPRKDYEKLISLYNQEKGKDYYFLSNYESSEYQLNIPFAKILDLSSKTDCSNGDYKKEGHLWIDIFPLDYITDNKVIRNFQIFKAKMYISWIAMGNTDWKDKKGFLNTINKLFVSIYRLIGTGRISKHLDNLGRKYNKKNIGRDNLCSYDWVVGPNDLVKAFAFENMIQLEFEGHKFFSISDPEVFLAFHYGSDFMELPPEDKRLCHSFRAWAEN